MNLEVGSILEGKVTSITKFGAFVALPGGKSGLVHISEIAHSYVSDVKDFLTEGQAVSVKVIQIDEHNRINLSIKQAAPPPPKENHRGGNRSFQGQNRNGGQPPRANRSEGAAPQRPANNPANQERPAHNNRNRGFVTAPPVQTKGPASFEDQLKRFMQESDSRQSDLNRGSDRRGSRRGNGRNRNNYE